MYLYYTVASQPEDAQLKAILSLGGFKSSNKIPNGKLNNMFSDISALSVTNYNQNRYIGLVLKNESGVDATDIYMWFDYPTGCFSKFRISALDMTTNSEGELVMEHVDSVNEQPVYADFNEADGEANKVLIGNLAAGEQIGIWIEMELLVDLIAADYDNVYTDDPSKEWRYLPVEKETIDDVGLSIAWT